MIPYKLSDRVLGPKRPSLGTECSFSVGPDSATLLLDPRTGLSSSRSTCSPLYLLWSKAKARLESLVVWLPFSSLIRTPFSTSSAVSPSILSSDHLALWPGTAEEPLQ